MHTTCVNIKDNAKSNDSDHVSVIRENTRLKNRCPSLLFARTLFSLIFANLIPREINILVKYVHEWS